MLTTMKYWLAKFCISGFTVSCCTIYMLNIFT